MSGAPGSPGSPAGGRRHFSQWELYQLHVDEYRFEVNLGAQRSQQFLALNTAILAAGAAVAGLGGPGGELLGAAVYFAGVLVAACAWLVTDTQHGYYRAARDQMRRAGAEAGVGDLALATTPGLGTKAARRIRVTTAYKVVYGLFGAFDFAAAAFFVTRW